MPEGIIRAGFQVLTPDRELISIISKKAEILINAELEANIKSLESSFKKLVEKALRGSPTYNDIINGDLHGHLGLVDPQGAMDAIITEIVKNIRVDLETVRFKKIGGKNQPAISVFLLRGDYENLLELPTSQYISKTRLSAISFAKSGGHGYFRRRPFFTGDEHVIPWLKWLLYDGQRILVEDYTVIFGDFGKLRVSRSKKALMRQSVKGWSMPAEHDGTEQDNFITRAFDSVETEMQKLIINRVKHIFRT